MDRIAARTKYLKEIESTVTSFNLQFENLVKSLGWTVDRLMKTNQELDEQPADSVETETTVQKKETVTEPAAETEDYEKLYNDLVANLPNQTSKISDKSQTQILAEMLETERNAKRRRISYKNKVHTRNKSQTEVLRALVREQMEVLESIAGPSEEKLVVEERCQLDPEPTGLIQLENICGGNPHTVWKRIGQILDGQSSSRSLTEKKSKPPEAEKGHKRYHQHNDRDLKDKSRDRRRDSKSRYSRSEREKSKREKHHRSRSRSPKSDRKSHSDPRDSGYSKISENNQKKRRRKEFSEDNSDNSFSSDSSKVRRKKEKRKKKKRHRSKTKIDSN